MKSLIKIQFVMLVTILLAGCSTVKVLNSWKAENAGNAKTKQFLVIARTDNNPVRKVFEDEIVQGMEKKGFNASPSYITIPELKPDRPLGENDLENIKQRFLSEGYQGVVLTVLKDVEVISKTNVEQGHYEGGTYAGVLPRNYNGTFPTFYGDFYGYFAHPSSYSTYGTWVEESFETQTTYNFVLETVVYDLERPGKEQLIAAVTSVIEEPAQIKETARPYVAKIIQALSK
jgi:hypothetical protein